MPVNSKAILAACLFLLVACAAVAEGWQPSADLGLAMTQSSYSNSWTGGEFGSLTWAFTGNLGAEKQLSPRVNWANSLKLQYGQNHQQAADTDSLTGDVVKKYWQSPQKSTDRIFLESLLKLTLGKAVDPFAAFTLDSQFYDNSVPQKPLALNPVLLTESVGVGRTLIASEETELFSRLGLAIRQKLYKVAFPIDPEDHGAGYDTESKTSTDGGLEWVTDFKHTFAEERMSLVNKLRLFKAFMNSESDAFTGETEDYWRTMDIALESTFSAAISQYIQMTFFVEFLYDKEVELRGRFRETLGLGISYKLF